MKRAAPTIADNERVKKLKIGCYKEAQVTKCVRILPINTYLDFRSLASCHRVNKQWHQQQKPLAVLNACISVKKYDSFRKQENNKNNTQQLPLLTIDSLVQGLQQFKNSVETLEIRRIFLNELPEYLRKYIKSTVRNLNIVANFNVDTPADFIRDITKTERLEKLQVSMRFPEEYLQQISYNNDPVYAQEVDHLLAIAAPTTSEAILFHQTCEYLCVDMVESLHASRSNAFFMHMLVPCSQLKYLSMNIQSSWHDQRSRDLFFGMLENNLNLEHLKIIGVSRFSKILKSATDISENAKRVLSNITNLSLVIEMDVCENDGSIKLIANGVCEVLMLCTSVQRVDIEIRNSTINSHQLLTMAHAALMRVHHVHLKVHKLFDMCNIATMYMRKKTFRLFWVGAYAKTVTLEVASGSARILRKLLKPLEQNK